MNQAPYLQHYPDDEIDLRELFATLWRGKWIIIATTFIFAVAGVAYALYQPDIYQANALLAPTSDESGGLGHLGGQLGGLASLAGLKLGGGEANKTAIAKEVLQSRAFLTGFIRRHELTVPLMGTQGWNKQREEWLYDRDIFNPDTGAWSLDDEGKSLKPTDWDLVKEFKEQHLNVSENKNNGMLTVSVKSQSPIAAKQWTDSLITDVNERIRAGDVAEAEARISYLKEKLNETNISGMQQVFYQLIESETRTVMLANAQQEYVFKTIDPAVVPQEKSDPKRALISALATVLGGMLGVFIVFVRAFIGKGVQSGVHELSQNA